MKFVIISQRDKYEPLEHSRDISVVSALQRQTRQSCLDQTWRQRRRRKESQRGEKEKDGVGERDKSERRGEDGRMRGSAGGGAAR